MYPHKELIALGAREAALRQRIAVRRWECAAAASRVARPLAWLDRMLERLRRLSPLAKVALIPLALLLRRLAAPRARAAVSILRWAPLVVGAVRGVAAFRGFQHRR